ncbi:MAG: metallopeptidase family protein [Rhodospirillaceae bacterium]
MSDPAYTSAPTLTDFQDMAEDAYALIPDELRRHTAGVIIRIEDFPDADTEDEMDLESPFDLLGLYRGVAVTQKSVSDPGAEPDMVFLYRRPILDYWCETGEDLSHLIRHVLIHEFGHHFGYSDADMDCIEQAADAAARDA